MGARVTIGLAYDGYSDARVCMELRRVIGHLTRFGAVNRLKVSEDAGGCTWIVREVSDSRELEHSCHVLAAGYFAEIQLVAAMLGHHDLGMTVRLVKPDGYFGFLLDFSEDDLLGSHSEADITRVTHDLIALMKDLYAATKYDYAFCDEEADLEYSPWEFRSHGFRRYSLAILPPGRNEPGTLSVMKAPWSIDGLTPRP